MQIDNLVPAAPLAGINFDWVKPAVLSAVTQERASDLLAELRHLLENGCSVTTALDVLEEIQLTLSTAKTRAAHASSEKAVPEILNLSRLLDEALAGACDALKQTDITVLRRKTLPRYVRAHEPELRALLHDVIQSAARYCALASTARMLRFLVRNDCHGNPSLIVEHSGSPAEPCPLVSRGAFGVEVSQEPSRCIIVLTFLNHA